MAAVGDDDAATVLLDEATAAGIDVALVRRTSGRSGTAWIMVRADGENAIVVDSGANATLTRSPTTSSPSSPPRACSSASSRPLPAVAQALSAARPPACAPVLNAAAGAGHARP